MTEPAKPTASTHGVILAEGKPFALVPREMLDREQPEPTQLLDRTASVELELEGEARVLDVYYKDDAAVIATETKPFVVLSARPLMGYSDVSRLLGGAGGMVAFAAETQLPGQVGDPGDPWVTYVCELNDRIRQRRSDPNRKCPKDKTLLEL